MTARRVAVVVGGASGIGRAAVRRLAMDGCAVAVLDRNASGATRVADDVRQAGGTSLAVELDVRDDGQVRECFARVQRELRVPYALVNSAGILDIAPALEISPAQWRRLIDVNLTGTFLCAQAAARAMVEGGAAGRIVNVASVHAGPISFLCSPDSSYITGAMLYVDGGMLLTTQV